MTEGPLANQRIEPKLDLAVGIETQLGDELARYYAGPNGRGNDVHRAEPLLFRARGEQPGSIDVNSKPSFHELTASVPASILPSAILWMGAVVVLASGLTLAWALINGLA